MVALWLCEGMVQKRDSSFCLPFCLRESCPPVCTLTQNTSVPPCVPLTFKLLPQCWSSKGVSLNNFMCEFFKRNYLEIQQFFPLTQSLLVFAARSYGTYLPDTGTLPWGPGVEPLTLKIPLPNFYSPQRVGTSSFHISASSPLLPVCVNVVSSIP